MAPLPSLIPPCQTADPCVFMSVSCRMAGLLMRPPGWAARSCGRRRLIRDVGALSQTPAEKNILAGNFVERDHQIVGRNAGRRDDAVVECLQQALPLLLGPASDEGEVEHDQVVRIGEAEE